MNYDESFVRRKNRKEIDEEANYFVRRSVCMRMFDNELLGRVTDVTYRLHDTQENKNLFVFLKGSSLLHTRGFSVVITIK